MIYTNITSVDVTLTYTLETRKPKDPGYTLDIINRRLGFHRVPIPLSYSIEVGPSVVPQIIKIPLTKFGESYAVSLAVGGVSAYFMDPDLKNIGDYNISLQGDSDDLVIIEDLALGTLDNKDNCNNYVCHVNDKGILFSGFNTNTLSTLNVSFKKTNVSTVIPKKETQTFITIPVVEYAFQHVKPSMSVSSTFSKLEIT